MTNPSVNCRFAVLPEVDGGIVGLVVNYTFNRVFVCAATFKIRAFCIVESTLRICQNVHELEFSCYQ